MEVTLLLKIGTQAHWGEKYLTQVAYFAHLIARWKTAHSGETSHLIQTAPKN